LIHSCLLDSSRLSQQVSGGIPDEKLRYLDPEGGYEDPDEGFRAELAAMTGQPKVSINALPTQAYLDATIVPTVTKFAMLALTTHLSSLPTTSSSIIPIAKVPLQPVRTMELRPETNSELYS
jgi:hypothetical protein